MFKSVFAKYIFAFVMIIFFSFLMLILVITSIIQNYSEKTKADIMETAARSSVTYLESKLPSDHSQSLEDTIQRNEEDIRGILTVVASHSDDITMLVANANGKVLLSVGNDYQEVEAGMVLPELLMGEATGAGGFITQNIERYHLFEETHYIYALPLTTDDGSIEGAVFVCVSSVMLTELLEIIIQTILSASAAILFATLIAVYFVSEKVIQPLREISKAAKSFASGNFDIRVPVRGRDEVAELAVAFNNMAESLNNYDIMRNTFMSNVSHDLRTPMTSIAGFIDGIIDGVIPPDKHQYYLQIVSGEVKRLSRLVSSLLDLSRIQAGERKFTMSPFDICEMGREILISFEQKINDKQLNVFFDCSEENISVIADRDAIYQVFYNLCDNAVKFAAEGGKFRISIQKLKNRKFLVAVYNEGQGISSADLPYVFDRFYKSDKSRGLNKSGVGLGLFISKTIVEAHGEKIWAESEFGKNCCFKFTLPGE